jgi:energy-coupling factor transport system substrate-specific component
MMQGYGLIEGGALVVEGAMIAFAGPMSALPAAYAALACLAYGFLLNLWLWPFTSGLPAQVAFVPEAAPMEHLVAWVRFSLVTSLGFDLPRAALTVIAILVAGRPILTALRRVGRKAAFGAQPTFEPAQAPVTLDHVPGRMST